MNLSTPATCVCLVALSAFRAAAANDATIDYARDVKPILARHCYSCHGPDESESDLRLDTAAAAIAGGVRGATILPGRSADSLLIKAVTGSDKKTPRMPPKDDAKPLPAADVDTLRKWIDQGANYPSDERPKSPRTKGSAHWAYRAIARPGLPVEGISPWTNNAIDAFVLARLTARGLTPSAPADRATVLRRLNLDLIGLPPSPEAVEHFLRDPRPGAYERQVDRLLDSPQFGERWGRHWLDLARYADSNGYTNDNPRTIWPYRDWVIKAINNNLPFDQFAIEQLAGDMLPNATQPQIVATGFHRNTQLNQEGGSDREEYRVEAVVDRVSTTGAVFMGLTIGCARCHDHKFDAISQTEFYQLFAFFNNQDEPSIKVPVSPGAKATTPTLVMRQRKTPRETHVHLRGNFLTLGKRVSANVPAVLPGLGSQKAPHRLHFARWLFNPKHPLTARVTANRVWQQYFGRGLVETENDFGTQGTPPTHPLLLDYLATTLISSQWDMKSLHRQIVMSATYRQSSKHRAELARRDPRNLYLGRQSRVRLEAEVIRDAALASSRLLSNKIGGPGVFPPQPAGVMKMTRNPSRKWTVSRGEDRYRRTMYTYFWRSTPYPFLKLFNAPESNTTCTRRDRSNTPLQALTMLNDLVFVEAAQGLAVRVLTELPNADADQRLRRAFYLSLSRAPRPRELKLLRELLDEEVADPSQLPRWPKTPVLERLPAHVRAPDVAAWTTIGRVLLNLDEFMTRE